MEGVAQSLGDIGSHAGNASYVINLVHGTWAKKAPWVRPRSALSRALREGLSEETRIFPFVWSGKNTNKARRLASEQLLQKLTLLVRKYPNARHYIISHSHAGNVILRALAPRLGPGVVPRGECIRLDAEIVARVRGPTTA